MAIVPTKDYMDKVSGLDRSKACTIQKQLIHDWEPRHEVWTLKYGHCLTAIVAGSSGYFINSVFRIKLRLLHQGFLMTNFLITAGPAFVAAMAHDQLVTSKIILHEARCPSCTAITATLALNFNAILYPLLLAPTISLSLAGNMGYRIPHILEYKELLKFWWSVFKPNSKRFAFLAFFNTAFANILTYRQFQSMETVTKVLQQVQTKLDEKSL